MATLNITIEINHPENFDAEALTRELTRYANEILSRDDSSNTFYISPRIRALETGFVCSDDLSADYKREISEGKTERYR